MKRELTSQFLLLTAALALSAGQAFGQTFAATGATTLSVNVVAESAIAVTANTNMVAATVGTFAAPYTGTTTFNYKVRTTKAGGAGTITVQITTDFTGAGGPRTAGGGGIPPMTYTCGTMSASGTACTGTQNASTTTGTAVGTFGADAHSAAGGSDSGSVIWSLPNDPTYPTGSYSATATFTISTT